MFTKEEIEKAKNVNMVDLLIGLNYRLKKITEREYALLEHNSLKISPTKGWFWHSRSVGGNAIDFFMIVEGMTFTNAVATILNTNQFTSKTALAKTTECREVKKKEEIELPICHWNNDRVIQYLTNKRGIDIDIVKYCINKGVLYESSVAHNAVFLGKNKEGKIKYVFQRGTTGKRFAGEIKGSDKRYGFIINTESEEALHIFESPIDLLSFLTMNKLKGIKNKDTYLSLSGVSLGALDNYLMDNKNIKILYVRTDNDEKGRKAYNAIVEKYIDKFPVLPAFPVNKDYNEDLVAYKAINDSIKIRKVLSIDGQPPKNSYNK